ncbi:hypothetical protein [Microbulbifer sp.]|uniref:hypothetical protein n=1 Tax=Microbulbifer sp. TaxID=1908541 RepID=UPI003F4128DB
MLLRKSNELRLIYVSSAVLAAIIISYLTLLAGIADNYPDVQVVMIVVGPFVGFGTSAGALIIAVSKRFSVGTEYFLIKVLAAGCLLAIYGVWFYVLPATV